MSILEVNHIKKVYKTRMGGDEVTALRDVHFSVEPGEFVAIMGEYHGRIRKWQDNASEYPCKP